MPQIKLEQKFAAHRLPCWAVAVEKESHLMATVSSDKTCKVFDYRENELLATLGDGTHSKSTRCVAFKPHSEFPTLAVGSFDATVSIWCKDGAEAGADDISESSEIIGENGWELLAVIEGHENEVKSVDWSCDGRYLATCSRDKSVWIWETDEANEEFECINVIQEHEQDVKNVKWHPFENVLASSSYDETCRVFRQDKYDDDDWLCVAKLDQFGGTVWCSDFEKTDHKDGTMRLVTSGDDAKVRIFKKIPAAVEKQESKTEAEESAGTSAETSKTSAETSKASAETPAKTCTENLAEKIQKPMIIPSSIKEDENWVLESVLPCVHNRSVYSVDWNDNGLIASCGSDGILAIYKEKSEKPGEWEVYATKYLAHGVCEVNCVKWCSPTELVTAGDDGNVLMWKIDE